MPVIHEIRSAADLDAITQRWGGVGNEAKNSGGPKIRSIADLPPIESFAAQQIDFIVEGFLANGTVNLLSGDSGCGKTTLIAAMASAVERGVPFAGLATQRCPVLYLDRENPLAVVTERFGRLGIPYLTKYWGGWCDPEAPDPGSPMVVEWVNNCNPKPLIIVDSLVAFFEGDENSASEIRPYMHAFRRLADMGATIVILHHSGKGDSARDYRGSSDIKAAVDIGYKLTNLGEPSKLSTLRLTAFKARFTVEPETLIIYDNGEFRIDSRGASQNNEDVLRDLLIANPGITASEFERLAVTKSLSQQRARTFLKNGIFGRSIDVEMGSHNSRFHTWLGLPK